MILLTPSVDIPLSPFRILINKDTWVSFLSNLSITFSFPSAFRLIYGGIRFFSLLALELLPNFIILLWFDAFTMIEVLIL